MSQAVLYQLFLRGRILQGGGTVIFLSRHKEIMPAEDIDLDSVKNVLIEKGWTHTHNPCTMTIGHKDLFVDLGRERP
jgi:hypothetical protein